MQTQTKLERLAVDIPEAAGMLSVSPRTIQNFISRKVLPARKLGRRTVISVKALERFLRTDHPSLSGVKNPASRRRMSRNRTYGRGARLCGSRRRSSSLLAQDSMRRLRSWCRLGLQFAALLWALLRGVYALKPAWIQRILAVLRSGAPCC
jgi:excisionase family DNA binding protein